MVKLFKTAGVESRAELEEVVKGHFRNAQVLTLLLICIFSYLAATLLIVKHLLVAPKVRDSWEELLDVETDWDEFLAKVKKIVFIYIFNTSID